MSAASAEPASPTRGPSAVLLVGIAVGLMVLSALVAVLIALRGGPIDGARELDAQFGAHALPFDLVLQSAREMPGGERMVVFESAGFAAESARIALDASAHAASESRVDWAKIAIPAATSAPGRVVFLFLTADAPDAHFDAFFKNAKWREVGELESEGGLVPVDTHSIAWRGRDVDFVHERAFVPGGTFQDVMRVNLSLEKKPCVMWAAWPRDEAASRVEFEKILAALSPP